MKNRLLWCIATCMLLSVAVTMPLAAGESANERGYTPLQKEYYLSDTEAAFIRPGLVLEILDVVIPADRQTEVTFLITDPAGLPLDRDGIFTPGPVSTSFILSYIPAGEEAYVAYTTRVQTSPITNESATQATSDSGGEYTDLGDGMYLYKFATVLPEDYDTGVTHTLGIYARRDLREFGLDRYVTNELDHFIPSGAGTPVPRDITVTATCNNCHNPLAIHGGARQEVGLCILCHNPTQSIDPDTGDSVDMPYMTHKIHAGVNLANGYTIIGYRQSEHDYSEVVFPTAINDCEVCHNGGTPTAEMPLVADANPITNCGAPALGQTTLHWSADGDVDIRIESPTGPLFAQGGPSGSKETGEWVLDGLDFLLIDRASQATLQEQNVTLTPYGCVGNAPYTYGNPDGTIGEQHTAWMTRPSRMACGSCHDEIDWETGEGHAAGPQADDEFCSFCHEPDTGVEYDASVTGAHTVGLASADLGGVIVTLKEVTDTGPGQRPTALFSLTDKHGALAPSELGRLRMVLSGPNEDFDFYAQEDALNALMPVGSDWSYTFNTKIPNDAEGSWTVSFEGRIDSVELGNGETERDSAENAVMAVAVTDDEADPRRMVVDDAKCEACHSNLTLHGDNRKNATDYCQTCHMPAATDEEVRLEGEPTSIHFKYMIHKIHRGAELENQPYIVYGYRSAVHDYSHVEYPGDLRDCTACHVGDTYNIPLPAGALPTHDPAALITDMGPETATCLSCHDGLSAASHADANTSDQFGESCSTCHGEGATYSVEALHAR